MRIRSRDFTKLRPVCRQARVRAHILKRDGLTRLMGLKRRRALIVSAIAAVGLMGFLSTRILVIQLAGNKQVPDSVILRALEEQGVYFFAPRRGFDSFRVSTKARVYDERIAYVRVDLDGVRCRVEIGEAVPGVETLDWSVPTDVVAITDGVIKSVAALDGKALVQPGDTVAAGDVLIAGDITGEEADHRLLVHARGEVLANRYYTAECVVLPWENGLTDTGRTSSYRKAEVAGRAVYETACPFAYGELRDMVRQGPFGTLLPVYLITGAYYEQAMGRTERTREEMVDLALSGAERNAYLKVPVNARIDDKTVSWSELEGGAISGVCILMTEESIGATKEIMD